jgi:hypothetical protein
MVLQGVVNQPFTVTQTPGASLVSFDASTLALRHSYGSVATSPAGEVSGFGMFSVGDAVLLNYSVALNAGFSSDLYFVKLDGTSQMTKVTNYLSTAATVTAQKVRALSARGTPVAARPHATGRGWWH